ncbi:hypothetical protein VNI00_010024 [Paramarasmius palmivorus]|uniref:BTB domain-containing protein n=1 Tax=Paramarasmius palmivorus TaxID=297713 RepID=A0AAW0CNP5_9AGAR
MDPAYPFPSNVDDPFDIGAGSLIETWVDAGGEDMASVGQQSLWNEGVITPTMAPSSPPLDAYQASTPTVSAVSIPEAQSYPHAMPTPGTQQSAEIRRAPVHISPVFNPNSSQSKGRPPADMILISNDNFVFYVDENTLCSNSTNQFNGLLPLQTLEKQRRVVFLREIVWPELQVFLQVIYNTASTDVPDLGTLVRGVAWLPKYGFDPKSFILPGTRAFDYLLSHAPLCPLDVYTCAGMHDIYPLAVQASSHLLRVSPSEVTEEMAISMGSRYLLKFFSLHLRRTEALKQLLMKGPELHNITKTCGFEGQNLSKARWNQGVAKLALILKADTTTTFIRDTILEATEDISCTECLKARDARLNTTLQEWSMTSRTI